MGSKVHKMLGYGLADVATQGESLTDPRINTDSPLLGYGPGMDVDDYLRFLEAKTDAGRNEFMLLGQLLATVNKPERTFDPCHAVGWDLEYGLPNVLCLRPVWQRAWFRLDNIIDYTQESWLNPDGQTNRVEVLRHGIYPFNGSYMDLRTGTPARQEIMNWVRACETLRDDNGAGSEPGVPALMDVLAQEGGFINHQDALDHVVPTVPDEVRNLAEFGQVFTHEDVWLQLRPMMYTWWA